jgi:hypothetical protein
MGIDAFLSSYKVLSIKSCFRCLEFSDPNHGALFANLIVKIPFRMRVHSSSGFSSDV